MNNNDKLRIALSFLVLLATAGCSEKYAHHRLGDKSPQFVEVGKMLDALRRAGKDGFDAVANRQIADGLDENRRQFIRLTLRQLVKAKKVELLRVDGFGGQMYRATIRYESQGEKRTLAILLVADGGRLEWAGRN